MKRCEKYMVEKYMQEESRGEKCMGEMSVPERVSVLSMCLIGGLKFPFESPSSARKADPRVSSYVNYCRLHRMDPVRETCIG